MKIVILCLLIARTCLGEQYNLTIQEFEEKFNITYGSAEEEATAAINLAAHIANINAQNEKYDNGDASDEDQLDDDDDLDDDDGDIYIMVKCMCVCQEKVTPPYSKVFFKNKFWLDFSLLLNFNFF